MHSARSRNRAGGREQGRKADAGGRTGVREEWVMYFYCLSSVRQDAAARQHRLGAEKTDGSLPAATCSEAQLGRIPLANCWVRSGRGSRLYRALDKK